MNTSLKLQNPKSLLHRRPLTEPNLEHPLTGAMARSQCEAPGLTKIQKKDAPEKK